MFVCEVTTVFLSGLNVHDHCYFLHGGELGGGGYPGQLSTNQSLLLFFFMGVIGIKLEFLRNFSEPRPTSQAGSGNENEPPRRLGFRSSAVPIFVPLADLGTVVDDLQMPKLPEGSLGMKYQPASRRSSSVPFKGGSGMKRRTIAQLSQKILY